MVSLRAVNPSVRQLSYLMVPVSFRLPCPFGYCYPEFQRVPALSIAPAGNFQNLGSIRLPLFWINSLNFRRKSDIDPPVGRYEDFSSLSHAVSPEGSTTCYSVCTEVSGLISALGLFSGIPRIPDSGPAISGFEHWLFLGFAFRDHLHDFLSAILFPQACWEFHAELSVSFRKNSSRVPIAGCIAFSGFH